MSEGSLNLQKNDFELDEGEEQQRQEALKLERKKKRNKGN